MRCNQLWLLALAIAGNAQFAIAQDATASDSARLQGTWRMVSAAADGTPMPPSDVSRMRRVFAGSEVTVTMSGALFLRAVVVLNPSSKPKAIDYHMTGGFTTGATQLGIYELRADTARFCMGSAKAPRPTTFATVAGDGRTLSMWVRERQ